MKVDHPDPVPLAELESREVFNTDQCAAYLQVSEKSVQRMVQTGNFPHFKIGDLTRFRKTHINQWTDTHLRGVL